MTSQTRTPTREPVASTAGTVPAVVPSVDGLRGLASLLVAIFHCWVFTDARLGDGDLRALVIAFGRGQLAQRRADGARLPRAGQGQRV